MIKKRNRSRPTLSFEVRLSEAAERLRAQAEGVAPGPEREALLHRVAQHQTALDLMIMLRQPRRYMRHG
jgi:hypothetical protein